MSILNDMFRRKVPREPWPLRFDNFSFDARCYNTLRCTIVFAKTQFALAHEIDGPSGAPSRLDWKNFWQGGFGTGDFAERGFPSTVFVLWTALDGVERETEVDLDDVFPGHVILHNVPREEVNEHAAANDRHLVDILFELNDRTINIYIRGRILTNRPVPEDPELKEIQSKLIQAWSKNY